jgi:hypothetical protein
MSNGGKEGGGPGGGWGVGWGWERKWALGFVRLDIGYIFRLILYSVHTGDLALLLWKPYVFTICTICNVLHIP